MTDPAEPAEVTESAPEGWLPRPAAALFGADATALDAYDLLTVDVPADRWVTALRVARDELGCTYFDWLSAVDEPGTGFLVCAHLAALPSRAAGQGSGGASGLRRLLLRTTVPHETAELPTATEVYAGAAWHERETHEMFGVRFAGHPHLEPLLLPDGFEGHPLRKDFVLAARVAKAWPGAKEPGEGHDAGGPKRRQMLPPGVPDPNEWGPLKGQLPPTPARSARSARGGAAGGGDRPRRTRSASAGSASQADPFVAPADGTESPARTDRPARRTRTASGGSASQRAGADAAGPTPPSEEAAPRPRRSRSVSEGSASQRQPAPEEPAPDKSGADKSGADKSGSAVRGGGDAPWHNPRPAFDETDAATPRPDPDTDTEADAGAEQRRTEDEG